MGFKEHNGEDLAQANAIRQATQKKSSAKTDVEANMQMAIHGASEVLVRGAPGLFSQKNFSTVEAYCGPSDTPESRHMTCAIANLSHDIHENSIHQDAPKVMMRWLVSDVLTQAQALRISIGAAHPEVLHFLQGDEKETAELARINQDLKKNLDIQKSGQYGKMDDNYQESIRMDIESGLHITKTMQNEIDRQGCIIDKVSAVRSQPGERLTVLGSIYNSEEQQTAAMVANYQYASITTGNPKLDNAIRASSHVVSMQDGDDTLVKYGISSSQAMVAHNYNACQSMSEAQISQKMLAMYELVKDAGKLQRQGQNIVLIKGASASEALIDSYGITTYEFSSMSSRGREAMNIIIENATSLSTSQKMNLGKTLQKLEEKSLSKENLPVIKKNIISVTHETDESMRKIKTQALPSPVQKTEKKNVFGIMRGAFEALSVNSSNTR